MSVCLPVCVVSRCCLEIYFFRLRFCFLQLPIDHYITHKFDGVEKTNDAIDALHEGSCLRAVVKYDH